MGIEEKKSFNGAVTFSLRKCDGAVATKQHVRGFNGAVTFSLRKSGLRDKTEELSNSLQWGRNFFVTEIKNRDCSIISSARFNGAVTFSLRKSGYEGRGSRYRRGASMGP